MPYDWRQEQEEANRRRAREEAIEAQQKAWNEKLAEDSRKSGEFWVDKAEKERQQRAQDRGNSTGCPASALFGITLVALIIALVRSVLS